MGQRLNIFLTMPSPSRHITYRRKWIYQTADTFLLQTIPALGEQQLYRDVVVLPLTKQVITEDLAFSSTPVKISRITKGFYLNNCK